MASENVGKLKVNCLSKVTFEWQIDNSYIMDCKDAGDFLISPNFTSYGYSGQIPHEIKWCLELYPKGERDDVEDYWSIYVLADTEITASGIFKIVNNEGRVIMQKNSDKIVFANYMACGVPRFSTHDFLMKSGILSNDKITIVCEITYKPSDEKDEVKEDEEMQKQEDDIDARLEVIDNFEALLNDNKFSDMSLISGGKVVKAHKCILANSSSVFAAMFEADMKESQENTIKIVDIEYNVLVEMIRFVYTGRANNINALVSELVFAADKYELDVLKKECVNKMLKNISIDNVIDYLQIADKLRIEQLREEAIKFIVEKGRSDVTDKPEFKFLPHNIMYRVCCGLSRKDK
ncbi:hypothetical protein TSAR_013350 [Trichomalopsis sarcophagae]|uniref:BTB domain-containing protein n=1 Tax=Trichomalopsis sarcophagae TaxID=543379 RepID=A0A232EMK3_9HYME|nr:hypothetical protein TSAR_013350 [Trichomalopsis sarcophagae]